MVALVLTGGGYQNFLSNSVKFNIKGLKMAKEKSRTTRWREASTLASEKAGVVRDAAEELTQALSDLRDVQGEYEEWRDNLPENLQQSALGEKLNAIVDDLDLESAADDPLADWSSTEEVIENAESADLPLGFGRD